MILPKNEFKIISHTIREDGAFIETGENDNLIVQKLVNNPEALGIFGFSFLDQNSDKLRGANVNGIAPELEKIMAGDYAISRSLYFYIKKNHIRMKPSIAKFAQEFTSEDAMGQYGYLMEKGLIPLPEDEYKTVNENTKNIYNSAIQFCYFLQGKMTFQKAAKFDTQAFVNLF